MFKEIIKTDIRSEIGTLKGVILHTPGSELQNMIPENASKALYSDILNLDIAKYEYQQLHGILNTLTKTYQVKDLLADTLTDDRVKENLVHAICKEERVPQIKDYLLSLNNENLSQELLEGVKIKHNSLTNFLSNERFILPPLYNFYFTRDASMAINDKILIGNMAGKVRVRESMIMREIFSHNTKIDTKVINPAYANNSNEIRIEGGDFLVASENVLCIGNGSRTSTKGIDFLIEYLKENKIDKHLIIQQLPNEPESFIHLDMVFTFLDKDRCMIYKPLIEEATQYRTIHVEIKNGKIADIYYEENILTALRKLGFALEPVYCGGNDRWNMDREQWHSGANFFAVAPGKVLGYARNVYTIEAMNKAGFEVIPAADILNKKIDINKHNKFVITIEGSELARGGGGCRCMTMPIQRDVVDWNA